MTREEKELALYCLKASSDYHSEVCEECIKYPNCDHTRQDDVTETIIKALEQEPFMNKSCVAHQVCHEDKVKVIDKIKAEIDQKQNDFVSAGNYYDGVRFGLMLAYQIIDKYKAESEE